MTAQTTLTPKTNIPSEVQALCEKINTVADGLPVLLFLPNADHTMLYPLVVLRDGAQSHARLVDAYLEGQRMDPPSDAIRRQQDLTLEAIHAAADYLPTVVFLPAGDTLHPVNLVSETVPEKLQPCYVAVQRAQQTAIGKQPLKVPAYV